MSRDSESIVFEARYWLELNDDVGAIAELVLTTASDVASLPVHLVTLLVLARGTPADESVAALMEVNRKTLARLLEIAERVSAIGLLIDGRAKALTAEAEDETPS